ncbi:MAG: ATP synthase F1 subunit gamma [Paludibacteraceae bacterium]|nr:ATP synthase F1 subunit gamma [Paludibacteraceae bacterium]
MASLKEIRSRISSVSSTRKITSAMKMVSAAKLKKAQNTIENSLRYQQKMTDILYGFISSTENDAASPVSEMRTAKRIAIIAVTSDSSLCGAFNNNIIKLFKETYNEYAGKLGSENIDIYPIGKKMVAAVHKMELSSIETGIEMTDKLDFAPIAAFMNKLMQEFVEQKIDEVIVIYNHFKNAGVQVPTKETLLPFAAPKQESDTANVDYIVEPGKKELVEDLIPKVIRMQLYSILQDSLAAEHGARTTAMQIATENADELVQELTLNYNKLRQAAITTEIITIIGGAEAIK